MSRRPQILLVSDLTELEWGIRPLLREWAEVAAFDAPGVGDEPPSDLPAIDAIARRGLAELDRRRWDRCVIVADEMAILPAVRIAAERPDVVAGIALGHACLRYRAEGADASINAAVFDAWMQMLRSNYAMLVRQDVQVWDPRLEAVRDPRQADALVERWLSRVAPATAERIATEFGQAIAEEVDLEPVLRRLDKPLLLAEHTGCVGWTHAGFAAAEAAFPEASVFRSPVKPSVAPEFADALRAFCARLPG